MFVISKMCKRSFCTLPFPHCEYDATCFHIVLWNTHIHIWSVLSDIINVSVSSGDMHIKLPYFFCFVLPLKRSVMWLLDHIFFLYTCCEFICWWLQYNLNRLSGEFYLNWYRVIEFTGENGRICLEKDEIIL